MKNHRINSYVNYGAIPSNEFSQNMNDRQVTCIIQTEKSFHLANGATRLLKRSSWLHEKNPKSRSKRNVKGFGWRANDSSMDVLQQFEYV